MFNGFEFVYWSIELNPYTFSTINESAKTAKFRKISHGQAVKGDIPWRQESTKDVQQIREHIDRSRDQRIYLNVRQIYFFRHCENVTSILRHLPLNKIKYLRLHLFQVTVIINLSLLKISYILTCSFM